MFNAQSALRASSFSSRVQPSREQNRLDIDEKTRSSVLPWRGQFSPQLVEYFIEKNLGKGGLVVDPFSGSGTVLYEAAAQGCKAIARDINPAAIALAKASSICMISKPLRGVVLEEIEHFAGALKLMSCESDELLSPERASDEFRERRANLQSPDIVLAFLILAFGDAKELTVKSIDRAVKALRRLVLGAPESGNTLSAEVGDARALDIPTSFADYLVTSPPYINVFNYHQNYRPIIQALGYVPLASARAEIGANRKFRMNRYTTVAQYCLDIALFFSEATRILKQGRPMTIVLGRESNVRGVSFKNGELVATIAAEGLGGSIIEWNERSFLNRFGTVIYEDVLTIAPKSKSEATTIEIGRSVGIEALKASLDYAPKDRWEDIENAISAAFTVKPSPYVLKENG